MLSQIAFVMNFNSSRNCFLWMKEVRLGLLQIQKGLSKDLYFSNDGIQISLEWCDGCAAQGGRVRTVLAKERLNEFDLEENLSCGHSGM
mmetsp:Transcript_7392/g.15896  ORF Transcript_7392/g.15896 Transcript_7392/m.15896 type:complete len:89 (+) Transcript_7392:10-276(+)